MFHLKDITDGRPLMVLSYYIFKVSIQWHSSGLMFVVCVLEMCIQCVCMSKQGVFGLEFSGKTLSCTYL